MAKALPRLAVLLEEDPRLPRAAPNVVAVLPATASHGAFIAVLSQARPKPAPAGFEGAFASAPAAPPALLQLHIYAHTPPAPAALREAAQAPDMMLLHSVSVYEEDLRWLSRHDAARWASATSGVPQTADGSAASLAATEAGALAGTAWVGPQFAAGDREAVDRASDTSAPGPTTVEAVAWVGLELVAVKTGQRQLLLVSSGLRPSTGAAASSSDEEDETDSPHVNLHRERTVRTGFARVQDFCATRTTTALSPCVSGAAPASVLLVAGLQRLTGVVCGGEGGGGHHAGTGAAAPARTRTLPPLTEHAWRLGPFQHVAATATAATPSTVVLCAASADGSVEVYTWCVDVAHRAAPPVCVHHVLMSAGTHVFYGAVVSTPVTPTDQHEICFWVLGGERDSLRDAEAEGGSNSIDGRRASLPALRGVDGRVLQVQPALLSATTPMRSGTRGEEDSNTNAGPRVLNALWSAASQCTAVQAGSPSVLEVSPSLRLETPPFLLAADNTGATAPPVPGRALKTRFALAVRGTGAGTRRRWSSAVRPLDSPDCAAALAWLGADPSSSDARAPTWTLLDAAVTRHAHELTLCTARRVLQLSVRPSVSLAAADPDGPLEVHVQGTHEMTDGQRLVGLATIRGCGEATPLLLLHGSMAVVPAAAAPPDSSDTVLSTYGQLLRKSSWAIATDLRAALLCQLQPWTPVRSRDAPPPGGSDKDRISAGLAAPVSEATILAKVEALVATEGARLQRHLDERLDRLEALLQRLAGPNREASPLQ